MGKTQIAMVPCPGVGHRAPMLQLGRLLVSHGFSVILLLIVEEEEKEHGHGNIEEEEEEGGGGVRMVSMHVEVSQAGDAVSMYRALERLGPSIVEFLSGVQPQLDCMIVDSTFPATMDLDIPVMGFCPHMAAAFSIFRSLPSPELPSDGVIKEVKEVSSFPGIRPISTKELPWISAKDHEMECFHRLLVKAARNLEGVKAMKWLVCNSIYELEKPAMDALINAGVPLLAIGPLFLTSLGPHKRSEDGDMRRIDDDPNWSKDGSNLSVCPWPEDRTCLEWLDRQSHGSVVFVSFGSIAMFDEEQLREIALGLEASGRPFLWVLRPDLVKNLESAKTALFPEGFLERTKGRRNLVSWVAQKSVLGHPAVGAFITHSGWNSTLESIAMGVPLLTWPYFGDQPLNSCYATLEWKVGLAFHSYLGEGVVGRGEVEGMIRRLMETEEGDKIRERCHAWRDVVAHAVQGGSSHASFHKLIHYLKTLSHG